jgi:hypothetical protein
MPPIRLALALSMALAAAGGDAPRATTPPFNGRDLEGWTRFGGKPEAWAVEDGMLVSLGEGGGWLGTTREYGDFDLTLEFRVAPGANSGVYLRAPADTTHISRTGMEIQILDDHAERYKTLKPWQLTGALYHVAAPAPGHLKPTGEWNRMAISLEGTHLVVTLNGATVVDDRLDAHPDLAREHPGLSRRSGRIGIQSHNGRVEFRNVAITEKAKATAEER